jgi:hypothetical protein
MPMKKIVYITILFLIAGRLQIAAQNAYFKIAPGTAEMQVTGEAGKQIPFFYYIVYHADPITHLPFSGYIRTCFITNKNSKPSWSVDSVNTVDHIMGGVLNDGDSMGIYGHIQISLDYFRNGVNNIIVIWPTGAKSGGQVIVGSHDSVQYPKNISITGLTGIDDPSGKIDQVSIFPNPAQTHLNIIANDPHLKITSARVFDINGNSIITENNNPGKIDVSALKNGTYFLEIICSDQRKSRYTFVVER